MYCRLYCRAVIGVIYIPRQQGIYSVGFLSELNIFLNSNIKLRCSSHDNIRYVAQNNTPRPANCPHRSQDTKLHKLAIAAEIIAMKMNGEISFSCCNAPYPRAFPLGLELKKKFSNEIADHAAIMILKPNENVTNTPRAKSVFFMISIFSTVVLSPLAMMHQIFSTCNGQNKYSTHAHLKKYVEAAHLSVSNNITNGNEQLHNANISGISRNISILIDFRNAFRS